MGGRAPGAPPLDPPMVYCMLKYLDATCLHCLRRSGTGQQERALCVFLKTFPCNIITGRNEVVAKVMFLLVSVILLTGGCLRQTPPEQTPPGTKYTPWD